MVLVAVDKSQEEVIYRLSSAQTGRTTLSANKRNFLLKLNGDNKAKLRVRVLRKIRASPIHRLGRLSTKDRLAKFIFSCCFRSFLSWEACLVNRKIYAKHFFVTCDLSAKCKQRVKVYSDPTDFRSSGTGEQEAYPHLPWQQGNTK